MTHSRVVWLLAVCWIALSIAVFLAIDASSGRSWLYLVAIALGPPIALIRLWPEDAPLTAAEMMHDHGDRS